MRIPERPPIGSNEWAAGGAHTRTGRALLANDPHLSLSIPGIWYLVDLQAPGFHAAGASIAGTPGIILGHNDRIAWGATNGTVAALSVFAAPASLPARYWVTERFHVRFGGDVTHRYYRAPHVFGVADSTRPGTIALVRWDAYDKPQSPVAAFLSLDGATSIRSALRALAHYPGPTQNFVLAGTDGTAAYHLAGAIPNDPAWARYEHPSRDLQHSYATIPFDRLPSVRASRDAVVFTANNKMYGAGYPYRLSATFSAPYRAYRIHQLLTAKKRYDVAYFTRMQLDTYSPAELEFARDLLRQTGALPALGARERDLLAHWDGRYDPGSRAAPVVHALRTASLASVPTFTAELDALRHGTVTHFADPPFARGTWGSLAAMTIEHQLSGLGLTLLDGVTLPGDGDNYTIHVQTPGFSQSFRAVWDVGNWDAGGIVIPSGESGEPGSGHYTDLSAAWVAGRLEPLPYSRRAVDAAARERLTLVP
jgi:penicillin amidase